MPRRSVCVLVLFFMVVAVAGSALGQVASETRRVTFVQWTDPHLFDAGQKRHGEAVLEESIDNRAALQWAVLETNRLVLVEHRSIDFIVITGDFGLENVDVPAAIKAANAITSKCPQRVRGDEGPIASVSLGEAAAEVARVLSALVVKRVYLVPGEKDLCGQLPADRGRWSAFVTALREAVAAQSLARSISLRQSAPNPPVAPPSAPLVEDLTYTAERLTNPKGPWPESPALNGISLLGVDSSYFASHGPGTSTGAAAEMSLLASRIHAGGSYLLFTHVPDMKDPSTTAALWDSGTVGKKVRSAWEAAVSRSELLGVFAGHLHSSNRDIYQRTAIPVGPNATIAAKAWVAPPLAVTGQSGQLKTARGMLLVTVVGDGAVNAVPVWFATDDQNAAAVGDAQLAAARLLEHEGRWDAAFKKYEDTLGLSGADARTRATALEGYGRAHDQMQHWWWQSPLSRWAYLNGLATAHTAWIVLAVVGAYGALRALRVFRLLGWLLKRLVVPKFRGRAVMNPTKAITDKAPAVEFTNELIAASEEIRRRLLQEQESWAARHINLLAPTTGSFDALVSTIPPGKSLDVAAWAKFVLAIGQTFRWNVDSGIAVFPPDGALPANAGDLPLDGRVSGYATLQWGGSIRNHWRREYRITGRASLKDVARDLAALILGEALL